MQIFITGATGNASSSLLNCIDKKNNDIYCLCRSYREIPLCNVLVGDISDIYRFKSIIEESDVIVHFASPRSNEKEIVFSKDILPTKTLLDCWKKGKFIYISSQTVFGICNCIIDDYTAYNPMCWYDFGKTVNELQLTLENRIYNRSDKIIVRLPLLFSYGPHRYDRQLIDQIYLHCKKNGLFFFKSIEDYNKVGSSVISDHDLERL